MLPGGDSDVAVRGFADATEGAGLATHELLLALLVDGERAAKANVGQKMALWAEADEALAVFHAVCVTTIRARRLQNS